MKIMHESENNMIKKERKGRFNSNDRWPSGLVFIIVPQAQTEVKMLDP
jgi:hypothetical protein